MGDGDYRVKDTEKEQVQVLKKQQGQTSRHPEGLSVNVVAPSQPDKKGKEVRRVWKGDLHDLSSSGVFISVPESDFDDFQIDGKVRIEMELPAPFGQFRSPGTVIGFKPDEKKKNTILVAIMLAETSAMDMEKLAEFLRKRDCDKLNGER